MLYTVYPVKKTQNTSTIVLDEPEGIVWHNNYIVTKEGEIYSKKSSIYLQLCHSNHGYYQVVIPTEGKPKGFLVHRIVAELYIPNPNNYELVNHINGNKTDNRVTNLEWSTYSNNALHAIRILGKGNTKKVEQLNEEGRVIKIFLSVKIASEETGISATSIRKVCRHEEGRKKQVDTVGDIYINLILKDKILKNK